MVKGTLSLHSCADGFTQTDLAGDGEQGRRVRRAVQVSYNGRFARTPPPLRAGFFFYA